LVKKLIFLFPHPNHYGNYCSRGAHGNNIGIDFFAKVKFFIVCVAFKAVDIAGQVL